MNRSWILMPNPATPFSIVLAFGLFRPLLLILTLLLFFVFLLSLLVYPVLEFVKSQHKRTSRLLLFIILLWRPDGWLPSDEVSSMDVVLIAKNGLRDKWNLRLVIEIFPWLRKQRPSFRPPHKEKRHDLFILLEAIDEQLAHGGSKSTKSTSISEWKG